MVINEEKMALLTSKEKEIAQLFFGEDATRPGKHTQSQIAKLLGVSRAYISQAMKKIRAKAFDEYAWNEFNSVAKAAAVADEVAKISEDLAKYATPAEKIVDDLSKQAGMATAVVKLPSDMRETVKHTTAAFITTCKN